MKIFLFAVLLTRGFAITPSEALARLIAGNQRYVGDQLLHPDRSSDRRSEIEKGQQPFACIVGCSDSRVPPEIIFDEGLGDLFVVRVAGNVVGPIELDSIEYSTKYLGAKVVLVMGHESCGAIKAVLAGTTEDIEDVASLIQPAIKNITNATEAIKANVRWTVAKLKQTPLSKKMIAEGNLGVFGAYYNLGTGKVELLK